MLKDTIVEERSAFDKKSCQEGRGQNRVDVGEIREKVGLRLMLQVKLKQIVQVINKSRIVIEVNQT